MSQDITPPAQPDRPAPPSRFPNAELRDGRWWIPVPPDPNDPEHNQLAEVNALDILRRRKNPIPITQLARLMGRSRHYLYKCVVQGRFPEGTVFKSSHSFLVTPSAAAWFVESHLYDPRD